MNLLCDSYIFYADVYFIQNFIIKVAVIYLSLYVNKKFFYIHSIVGIMKILAICLLAIICEILGLLYGNLYPVLALGIALSEIPILLWVILRKERNHILHCILAGYFFTLVINGLLEILWNLFGRAGGYVFYLLAACGIVYVIARMYSNYKKMSKGILLVELRHEDRRIVTYGLYDSGNCLKDPYTGKGVHIISEELLRQLQLDNQEAINIPYHSLGNMDGRIRRFEVEYLKVQNTSRYIEKNTIPIGVADKKLFENKRYQMILNEDIM